MADFPSKLTLLDRVEPVPRRIRGLIGGRTVFDTTAARYVWEANHYPQYYVPEPDVDTSLLVDEGREQRLKRGTARRFALKSGDREVPEAVRIYQDGELAGYARFEWGALDAWFEEDQEVIVHPRNPYHRVDAIRSSRHVQVYLAGALLADTHSPVLLFETSIATRYYLPRTDVRWEHLVPSQTRTGCPYKGFTSGYWSGGGAAPSTAADIAWAYDFPLPECQAIAGLVAFYNEKVDIVVDGTPLVRAG